MANAKNRPPFRYDIVGSFLRPEALKENRQLVELTAAEKWNGVLPTTMTPSGSVPFVKVGQ